MAVRKSKVTISPEPKPDLTPMIDIVFNLIIFFMIVSELSNLDVEQLELPYADNAQEPKKGGQAVEKILQVNVLPKGLIKVRGKGFTTDIEKKGDYPWLADFLEIEAAGYEREDENPDQPGTRPSKLRVNIRADKQAAFRHVQGVFDACMRHGIYKTSLAATQDDPEMR